VHALLKAGLSEPPLLGCFSEEGACAEV